MKANQKEIRDINDASELVRWLSDQAINALCIFLFPNLKDHHKFRRSARLSAIVSMSPALAAIAHSNMPFVPSEDLANYLGDCMAGLLPLAQDTELHDIIYRLAEIAMIRHCLNGEWVGDVIRITSTKKLTRTHFVSINVAINHEQRRQWAAPWGLP
ncbi:hypothetical protein NKJ71_09535 [Mesorhizobium sp. M0050]|uniref:hypothetical protein n=1 Tax=Mesorhizobium sp. M0050 TaxID=2956861 RepID=UPI00333535E2